jgi:lipopolysaccharide export system protein LptA
MLLYYNNPDKEKASGNLDLKIDKIVATGNVKITRPDGAFATAEKAVYYQGDEKVVLTGKPIVKQGNDFVEGTRITLYLKEQRSIVEGSEEKKVRAVISPRSKKR